jgi:hypothetical protein
MEAIYYLIVYPSHTLTRLTSVDVNKPGKILFAFPNAQAGIRCLAIIIWKSIIQHFYSIQTATAPTNTALIWAKSLRRYAELCLRYESHARLKIACLTDRGKPLPDPAILSTNMAPPAELDATYNLRWSDDLYEELSRQDLEKFIKYGRYGAQGGTHPT